jgi:hypothetical protein
MQPVSSLEFQFHRRLFLSLSKLLFCRKTIVNRWQTTVFNQLTRNIAPLRISTCSSSSSLYFPAAMKGCTHPTSPCNYSKAKSHWRNQQSNSVSKPWAMSNTWQQSQSKRLDLRQRRALLERNRTLSQIHAMRTDLEPFP